MPQGVQQSPELEAAQLLLALGERTIIETPPLHDVAFVGLPYVCKPANALEPVRTHRTPYYQLYCQYCAGYDDANQSVKFEYHPQSINHPDVLDLFANSIDPADWESLPRYVNNIASVSEQAASGTLVTNHKTTIAQYTPNAGVTVKWSDAGSLESRDACIVGEMSHIKCWGFEQISDTLFIPREHLKDGEKLLTSMVSFIERYFQVTPPYLSLHPTERRFRALMVASMMRYYEIEGKTIDGSATTLNGYLCDLRLPALPEMVSDGSPQRSSWYLINAGETTPEKEPVEKNESKKQATIRFFAVDRLQLLFPRIADEPFPQIPIGSDMPLTLNQLWTKFEQIFVEPESDDADLKAKDRLIQPLMGRYRRTYGWYLVRHTMQMFKFKDQYLFQNVKRFIENTKSVCRWIGEKEQHQYRGILLPDVLHLVMVYTIYAFGIDKIKEYLKVKSEAADDEVKLTDAAKVASRGKSAEEQARINNALQDDLRRAQMTREATYPDIQWDLDIQFIHLVLKMRGNPKTIDELSGLKSIANVRQLVQEAFQSALDFLTPERGAVAADTNRRGQQKHKKMLEAVMQCEISLETQISGIMVAVPQIQHWEMECTWKDGKLQHVIQSGDVDDSVTCKTVRVTFDSPVKLLSSTQIADIEHPNDARGDTWPYLQHSRMPLVILSPDFEYDHEAAELAREDCCVVNLVDVTDQETIDLCSDLFHEYADGNREFGLMLKPEHKYEFTCYYGHSIELARNLAVSLASNIRHAYDMDVRHLEFEQHEIKVESVLGTTLQVDSIENLRVGSKLQFDNVDVGDVTVVNVDAPTRCITIGDHNPGLSNGMTGKVDIARLRDNWPGNNTHPILACCIVVPYDAMESDDAVDRTPYVEITLGSEETSNMAYKKTKSEIDTMPPDEFALYHYGFTDGGYFFPRDDADNKWDLQHSEDYVWLLKAEPIRRDDGTVQTVTLTDAELANNEFDQLSLMMSVISQLCESETNSKSFSAVKAHANIDFYDELVSEYASLMLTNVERNCYDYRYRTSRARDCINECLQLFCSDAEEHNENQHIALFIVKMLPLTFNMGRVAYDPNINYKAIETFIQCIDRQTDSFLYLTWKEVINTREWRKTIANLKPEDRFDPDVDQEENLTFFLAESNVSEQVSTAVNQMYKVWLSAIHSKVGQDAPNLETNLAACFNNRASTFAPHKFDEFRLCVSECDLAEPVQYYDVAEKQPKLQVVPENVVQQLRKFKLRCNTKPIVSFNRDALRSEEVCCKSHSLAQEEVLKKRIDKAKRVNEEKRVSAYYNDKLFLGTGDTRSRARMTKEQVITRETKIVKRIEKESSGMSVGLRLTKHLTFFGVDSISLKQWLAMRTNVFEGQEFKNGFVIWERFDQESTKTDEIRSEYTFFWYIDGYRLKLPKTCIEQYATPFYQMKAFRAEAKFPENATLQKWFRDEVPTSLDEAIVVQDALQRFLESVVPITENAAQRLSIIKTAFEHLWGPDLTQSFEIIDESINQEQLRALPFSVLFVTKPRTAAPASTELLHPYNYNDRMYGEAEVLQTLTNWTHSPDLMPIFGQDRREGACLVHYTFKQLKTIPEDIWPALRFDKGAFCAKAIEIYGDLLPSADLKTELVHDEAEHIDEYTYDVLKRFFEEDRIKKSMKSLQDMLETFSLRRKVDVKTLLLNPDHMFADCYRVYPDEEESQEICLAAIADVFLQTCFTLYRLESKPVAYKEKVRIGRHMLGIEGDGENDADFFKEEIAKTVRTSQMIKELYEFSFSCYLCQWVNHYNLKEPTLDVKLVASHYARTLGDKYGVMVNAFQHTALEQHLVGVYADTRPENVARAIKVEPGFDKFTVGKYKDNTLAQALFHAITRINTFLYSNVVSPQNNYTDQTTLEETLVNEDTYEIFKETLAAWNPCHVKGSSPATLGHKNFIGYKTGNEKSPNKWNEWSSETKVLVQKCERILKDTVGVILPAFKTFGPRKETVLTFCQRVCYDPEIARPELAYGFDSLFDWHNALFLMKWRIKIQKEKQDETGEINRRDFATDEEYYVHRSLFGFDLYTEYPRVFMHPIGENLRQLLSTDISHDSLDIFRTQVDELPPLPPNAEQLTPGELAKEKERIYGDFIKDNEETYYNTFWSKLFGNNWFPTVEELIEKVDELLTDNFKGQMMVRAIVRSPVDIEKFATELNKTNPFKDLPLYKCKVFTEQASTKVAKVRHPAPETIAPALAPMRFAVMPI